jgi:hypothetical protein
LLTENSGHLDPFFFGQTDLESVVQTRLLVDAKRAEVVPEHDSCSTTMKDFPLVRRNW